MPDRARTDAPGGAAPPAPTRRMVHDRGAGPAPGVMTRRALRLACPVCGHRPIFHRWFRMDERCPGCGLRFERVVGHWFGSLTINTIVCFGLLLAVILGGFLLSWPDAPEPRLLVAGVALAVASPLLVFPWSRTVWLVIDLLMRPLEAEEAPGLGAGRPAAAGPSATPRHRPGAREGHGASNNH